MDKLRDLLNAPRANDIDGQNKSFNQVKSVKFSQNHGQNGRFLKKTITKNQDEEMSNLESDNFIGQSTQQPNKILKPVISKRLKKNDFQKAKVISLGFPRDLMKESQNGGKPFKGKKRFAIEVKYKDDKGKSHTRNVLFGNVEDNDYSFTGDELARLRCTARLKHTDNFLHQNFYRLFLLNSPSKNMVESYSRLREAMGV